MTPTPSPPGAGLLPFGAHSVRYLIDPTGAAHLVARDVLNILGLDISRNPGRWLTKVPETEKSFQTITSAQGPQRSIVISPAAAVAFDAINGANSAEQADRQGGLTADFSK